MVPAPATPVYPVLRRDVPVRGYVNLLGVYPTVASAPVAARAPAGRRRRRPVGAALVAATVLLRGNACRCAANGATSMLRGRRHVGYGARLGMRWSRQPRRRACSPACGRHRAMGGRRTTRVRSTRAAGTCLSEAQNLPPSQACTHRRLRAGSRRAGRQLHRDVRRQGAHVRPDDHQRRRHVVGDHRRRSTRRRDVRPTAAQPLPGVECRTT